MSVIPTALQSALKPYRDGMAAPGLEGTVATTNPNIAVPGQPLRRPRPQAPTPVVPATAEGIDQVKQAEQPYSHPALKRINMPHNQHDRSGMRTMPHPTLRDINGEPWMVPKPQTFVGVDNIVRKALPEGYSYYYPGIRNEFANVEDAKANPHIKITATDSRIRDIVEGQNHRRARMEEVPGTKYSPAGIRNITPWWKNNIIRPVEIQYDRLVSRESQPRIDKIRASFDEINKGYVDDREREWTEEIIAPTGMTGQRYPNTEHGEVNAWNPNDNNGYPTYGLEIQEKPDPTSLNELSRQSVKSMGYDQPATPHGNIEKGSQVKQAFGYADEYAEIDRYLDGGSIWGMSKSDAIEFTKQLQEEAEKRKLDLLFSGDRFDTSYAPDEALRRMEAAGEDLDDWEYDNYEGLPHYYSVETRKPGWLAGLLGAKRPEMVGHPIDKVWDSFVEQVKQAEQPYRHPALNRMGNIPGPGLRTFEDNIVRKALPEGQAYYHNPIRNEFDNLEDALEAKPRAYYTATGDPRSPWVVTPRGAAEDADAQRDIAERENYPWDQSGVDARNDYSPAGLRDQIQSISPWWNNNVIRPAKIQYDRALGRYGKSYQTKEQLRKELEEVDAMHAATTERAWNRAVIGDVNNFRGPGTNRGEMIPEKPDPASLKELSRRSVKSMGYDQPATPHGNIEKGSQVKQAEGSYSPIRDAKWLNREQEKARISHNTGQYHRGNTNWLEYLLGSFPGNVSPTLTSPDGIDLPVGVSKVHGNSSTSNDPRAHMTSAELAAPDPASWSIGPEGPPQLAPKTASVSIPYGTLSAPGVASVKQAGSFKTNLRRELSDELINSRPQNQPGFIPLQPQNPGPGAAQAIKQLPAVQKAMKAIPRGILPPKKPAKGGK